MDSTAVLHRLDQAILRHRDLATAWSDLMALCRAESGGDDAYWDRIAAKGCSEDLVGIKQWLVDSLRQAPPPRNIGVLAFVPDEFFCVVQADGYESWDNVIDKWNWPDQPPYEVPGGFRPDSSNHEIEKIWEAQRSEGYKETLTHEAVFIPFAPIYMVDLLLGALGEIDPAVLLAGAPERRILFTVPDSKSVFLLGTVNAQGFRRPTQAEFDNLKATDNWHERKGAMPKGPALAASEPEPSFMKIKPAKPDVSAKEMAASLPSVPESASSKAASKAKPAPAKPAAKKAAPKKAAAKKPAPKKAAKKSAAKKAGGKNVAAKKSPAKKSPAKKAAPKKPAAKKGAPKKAAKKTAPAKKAKGKPGKKK